MSIDAQQQEHHKIYVYTYINNSMERWVLSIEPLRSIKLNEPFRNYLIVQSEADSEIIKTTIKKNRTEEIKPYRQNQADWIDFDEW